jgi:hypothetical protein
VNGAPSRLETQTNSFRHVNMVVAEITQDSDNPIYYHILMRRSEAQFRPEARATFSEIYEKTSDIPESRWAIIVRRSKASDFRGLE